MKVLNIVLLIIVSMIYIVPLLIISFIAIILRLLGLCQDFTSILLIVNFIKPITILEDRIMERKRKNI